MKKLALIALLALTACREETAEIPAPVEMTAAAVGYYCQMDLLEHPGPKAQIHLKDVSAPIFFAQVRDALAFQRMPEQNDVITAIYVSDMDRAKSWAEPGADNWTLAPEAWFVMGSKQAGGMGADEMVPFATEAGARAFASTYGGKVLRMGDIPDSAVLAPASGPAPIAAPDDADADYLERLKAATKGS
ncbi:MAG: nitrous oxide reductase accessory protein NosL [Paracoccus sp.]|nr:nitrous oxide reductase accessory protein NosL [Paracoccus sp. (in: a-proteobacteria)]